MRYGKGGEVFRAEREEFDGPAAEDQTVMPRFERVCGDGLDGLCDQPHDVVGVVVELMESDSNHG